MSLDFERDGAALFRNAVPADDLAVIAQAFELGGRPGRRLIADAALSAILDVGGSVGAVAAALIGPHARPVRAVAFDKTASGNWSVAWHQDRTIVVEARTEVEGYGPWSTKDGLLHVAPPISVLEDMATLRVHLDDCGETNAPLNIALGSHKIGFVPASEAASVAEQFRRFTCQASRGDVWAYSTPILHSSEPTKSSGRRRVLQVDYAARPLPGDLKWRGLG